VIVVNSAPTMRRVLTSWVFHDISLHKWMRLEILPQGRLCFSSLCLRAVNLVRRMRDEARNLVLPQGVVNSHSKICDGLFEKGMGL
jgi:hypothetical protein